MASPIQSLWDIRKARLEKPYNLPTDPPIYRTFIDFDDRYTFIMKRTLLVFFRLINRALRVRDNLTDTSSEEEEDADERGGHLNHRTSVDVSDNEHEEGDDENEEEHEDDEEVDEDGYDMDIYNIPSPREPTPGEVHWVNRFRDIGIYGNPRRNLAQRPGGRSLEPRELLPPGIFVKELEEHGKRKELKIINFRYPPVLEEASPSSSDGNDSDDNQSRFNDRSRSPSWRRKQGYSSRKGDSSKSSKKRQLQYPDWYRNSRQRHPWLSSDVDGDVEMSNSQGGDVEENSWTSVFAKLPPISGGRVPPKGPETFGVDQEICKYRVRDVLNPFRRARIRSYFDKTSVAFVGEQCPLQAFRPCRGDLVILPRSSDVRSATNEPKKTYLTSYPGDGGDVRQPQFTGRELVLRIGTYAVHGNGQRLHPFDFEYHPFSRVELYASSPMETRPPTKWKFLGYQRTLQNGRISRAPYESPGKHLQVGHALLNDPHVEPVVPQRGDVIIKRETWDPYFHHNVNFWYSMVKWYRDRPFPFKAGDLLIRRFLDNHYNHVHPHSNIPRDTELWGWAELYEFHDFHGWIFWGRTKHLYDFPSKPQGLYLRRYAYDNGEDSDEDIQHERVNPRR